MSPATPVDPDVFAAPPADLARALIGTTLLHEGVGGTIVETEAYSRDDPASHSFRGPSPRNRVMFGPPGHLYVYRSYGIHWCANVVCGPEPGGAVLIRALQPTLGLDIMRARRGVEPDTLLCGGPGRVCQALAITDAANGASLNNLPFVLLTRDHEPDIVTGPRIGLTKGVDTPWRFGLRGSRYLSRRFPPVR